MGRHNVWLPAELEAEVAAQLPGVGLSEVLQGALRDRIRLDCEHSSARCVTCGHELDRAEVEDAAVFWVVRKAIDALHGGDWLLTSLDAARLVHRIAERRRHPVGKAPSWSNAERARRQLTPTSVAAGVIRDAVADERARWTAGEVTALPSPAARAAERDAARRRHPTARPAPAGANPAPPTSRRKPA